MAYIKAVSDQPITRFDHVVVAVMRKFSLEPVGGLARATASNRIRHDDEVFRRIERLPGRKQLVVETRAQPIRAGASVAAFRAFERGMVIERRSPVMVFATVIMASPSGSSAM